MAILDDVRLELQLDVVEFSDASIQHAVDQVGSEELYLVCAYVLRMWLNRNKGRRQLTIGSFNESVDVKEIRARIKFYQSRSSAGSNVYQDIEDSDYIFTKAGI